MIAINEFLSSIKWETIPEEQGFDALPEGEYACVVDSVEIKQTKSGDGAYINFKYKVVEGDFCNRFLFDNVNIHNQSQEAVKIGLSRLKRIASCAGLATFSSIESLNGKIFMLTVIQQEHEGKKQNRIKAIGSYDKETSVTQPMSSGMFQKQTEQPSVPKSMWSK